LNVGASYHPQVNFMSQELKRKKKYFTITIHFALFNNF